MQLGKQAGLKLSDAPLRNVFGDALLDLAKSNPKVVVLDGDLGNSTKAEYVRNEFPERFFNIGIAESNLVGVGAGLAGAGFYPFIVSFSSFLLCNAYDQIRLAVAMSEIDATIIGSHGGITLGKDGPTQMGIEDLALMGGLPTFTIIVPSDPATMHAAVKAAPDIKGPVFIRSSRVPMPFIYPMEDTPFEVGKANVVREGTDLTIIGCGMMVSAGLDAAAVLAEEGIEARVLDLHTIRPMDIGAIAAAASETGAIVCAEEHLLQGGMGSNVARVVAEENPVPMRFVGLKDVYVESGDPWDLLKKYNLTADDIVAAGREVVKAKKAA
ncbi:MAG: transketolase family protein [Chloroflexi bacterium]|nr:MAG: transketolase family protein [Chloroflexota bacterium]MBL1196466.1 transketolase family protein [Chloroflexota bacterium]NOH13761.1 transketolase family protein [Chloroflexota bacterium]